MTSIVFLVSVFSFVIKPYNDLKNTIRNYIHRCILLLICSLQIVFKLLKKDETPSESIIYSYPILLLILVFLGLLCSGLYTIHQCVLFWKSKPLIDLKLKLQQ
jgi:hypothetical protein